MTTIPRNTFCVETVEQTHETDGLLYLQQSLKKVKTCTRGKSYFHRYSITAKCSVFKKNITRQKQVRKEKRKVWPIHRKKYTD